MQYEYKVLFKHPDSQSRAQLYMSNDVAEQIHDWLVWLSAGAHQSNLAECPNSTLWKNTLELKTSLKH